MCCASHWLLQATWPSSVTGGFVIPFQGQPRPGGEKFVFHGLLMTCCWEIVKKVDADCISRPRKIKENQGKNQGKSRKIKESWEVHGSSSSVAIPNDVQNVGENESSRALRSPDRSMVQPPGPRSTRCQGPRVCIRPSGRDEWVLWVIPSRRFETHKQKNQIQKTLRNFQKMRNILTTWPTRIQHHSCLCFIIRIQFPRPEYRRELHNQGWGLLLPRWGKIPWGSFHVFSHAWLSRSFARCIMYVVPCRTMSYLTRPYTSVSDLRKVQKLGLTTESMFVFDMEISHTTWVTRVTRLSCCLDCAVSFLGRVGPSCHADLDYGHSIYPFHFVDPFCCFWFLGNIDIEHAQQSLASIWVVHV